MEKEKIVQNTVFIQAPPSRVWEALINPQETKKYMFGCETVSEWLPGSDLLWQGTYEGRTMVFVSGKVLEIRPERYLAYSVIDPNSSIPQTPENHLKVTYSLSPKPGGTELLVTQSGFETVAEGEKRYQDSYNNGEGWNPILVQIKQLAEQK